MFFRKRLCLLTALAAALVSLSVRAARVDADGARAAAEGFLKRSSAAQRILPDRAVASVAARGSLWIAALEPSGHIVIASSDKCAPIVSFSPEDFAEPEAGSSLDALLRGQSDWVDAVEADETAETDPGWTKYAASPVKKARLLAAPTADSTADDYPDGFVAPFLGAKWGQNAPYNDLSPLYSLCGCVATAGGQEHRYWRWPYRYETSNQYSHSLRNSLNEHSQHVIRVDGRVPFDYDKIWASYPNPASTPLAADKVATYNAAYLSLWMQSLTHMIYKPGGSGAAVKIGDTHDKSFFEYDRVYSMGSDGYTNLWKAIKTDIDWGSPVQINTPAHQMVVDGYAIEDGGTENEVDYINVNLGYGYTTHWTSLRTAVTSGDYSGVFAHFQIGYRPKKMVQFEPLPKVCGSDVTLAWHIPPCYTNKISGFLFQTEKDGEMDGAGPILVAENLPERYTYTAKGLQTGSEYTFTVTPIMANGEGAGVANSVTTAIGTPAAAPEILGVSSVACGIELVQQDIFAECARGIVNQFKVTCSESVTGLAAYSSHLTVLPDEKIGIASNGNGSWTVSLDATEMKKDWDGDMLLLTLVAANADGTETAKNLMLRFNSMRNVMGGTFDVADANASSAVWFAGGYTTTLDAKGKNITFAAGAVNGTGTLVLTDSVGGGSFTFAGLNGFTGTLKWDPSLTVNLPADMSGFSGTLSFDSYAATYHLSRSLPSTAKVYIGGNTQIYIDNNATIDAAITGSGIIMVIGSAPTFNDMSDFSGTISLGDENTAGTATLRAEPDQKSKVVVDNGTLYLTLEAAQVAYGYETSAVTLNEYASLFGLEVALVFQDESGKQLASWTSSQATYSIAATANTWTPDLSTNYGNFGDTARWSFGRLPIAGEYVIFSDTSTDGFGSEMKLNLSADLTIEHVKVVGNTKFTISATDGSSTLYVNKLENARRTTLNTPKIQPTSVVPNARLDMAEGITVDCEIDSSIAQNIYTPTGISALYNADFWNGTVVFKDRSIDYNLDPQYWCNAESRILFTGAAGYVERESSFAGEVILRDSGATPALHLTNGYNDDTVTIEKLTGDGTLKTSTAGVSETILVKDASEFVGALDLAKMTVAIASEMPSGKIGNDGWLYVCQAATVPSGKTWSANGGIHLGNGADLTVEGALASSAGSVATDAAGAKLTLADGGLLQLTTAMSGDYAPTLDFRAGTLQFLRGITETKAVNFCAAAGRHTTLDACGNTVTLGANFFSGAGDVYLTSSQSNGRFILNGVGESFTGTIRADISAGVTLSGDISQSSGRIAISDILLTVPSSSLGNVEVGAGSTLFVTVSKGHRISGLEIDASQVSLVDGGTLVLQDSDGKALATFTAEDAADGKYVLAPDASISPVCVLDYEFNGNMASVGTDTTALTIYSGSASYYNNSALYTKSVPYISKEFAMPDDEWTTFIRCTLPAADSEKPTIVLMYGVNGGNLFGLVAGASENTVALADKNGLIGEEVSVENATTKYHVYSIVKTSNRVRLYVDGELKVNELATISVAKKFQIGSVHGSNYTSYDSCTDQNARIDFLKFYDFAADEEFIDEQLDGLAPKPTAVWLAGEFGDAAADHGGYAVYTTLAGAINSNDNIEIGDNASLGAWINVASVTNCTAASVLVKFKAPKGGAPTANAAIAGVLDTDGNRMGALCTTSGGTGFTGFHQSSSATALTANGFDFSTTPALSSTDGGEGYMLFAFQSDTGGSVETGTALYLGETIDGMTGGAKAALQWRGKSIRTLSIGGPAASTSVSPSPWTGLEIEAVALFVDQWLTAEDVELYRFPEAEPVIAVIPGTVSTETMTQTNVVLDAAGEWAVIGDTPIFFTVPSNTNIFTVAFDAYVPDAVGTVFGFEMTSGDSSSEIKARRTDDGTFKGLHTGTTEMGAGAFTGGTTVLSPGAHHIMVEYDHRNDLAPESIRGTTITVDGVNVYHSKGLSWKGRAVTLFSIGGAAITNEATDVLTGLKVKNLTFIGGMFKDQTTGEDAYATVNGVSAATYDENLSLVRIFGLTPAAGAVTFAIDAIDPAAGVLSLDVSPSVANGSLSVLAKEALSDAKWTRAKVFTGADAAGGEIRLDDDDLAAYRFFKLRAEEGAPAKGSQVK